MLCKLPRRLLPPYDGQYWLQSMFHHCARAALGTLRFLIYESKDHRLDLASKAEVAPCGALAAMTEAPMNVVEFRYILPYVS